MAGRDNQLDSTHGSDAAPGRFSRQLARYGLWPSQDSSAIATEEWFYLAEADPVDVRLLYEKTFAVLSTFLDWRYKSMSLGFAVLAAAVALDEWLFVHTDAHWTLAGPLVVSCAFSLVVRRFDARNQTILNDAYQAGGVLEQSLGAPAGGMMRRIPQKRPLWTYHETIKVVFGWAAVACALSSFAAVVWSIVDWVS